MKNLYFSNYKNRSLIADFYTLFTRGYNTDSYFNKQTRGSAYHKSMADKLLNGTKIMKG